MDRFRKMKNKSIWWTIFWVIVLSTAFLISVYSKSKAAPNIGDGQQTTTVFTCYSESPYVVAVGISPDRPTAVQSATRSCQRQSPAWQTCRLSGCVPF